jgi:hypothetical protein
VPFRRLAAEIGLAVDLGGGLARAARLLDPILSGAVTTGRWDPSRRAWPVVNRET